MKKTIDLILISLIFGLIVSSSGSWCIAQVTDENSYSGIIIADSVNLRSGPGVNFEILRKINKGNSVLVLGTVNNEWVKLSLPRNSNAFIHKDFVQVENNIFGVITAKRVNVRAGEGTNFNVIGQLNPENRVEIILKGKDWLQVYPYTNCFAWVHKDFIKKSGPAKSYIDSEAKKREGLKLLIEAETFEKQSKAAEINSKDLSPIIQKYKVIIRDYAQSPANEIARRHINRLTKSIMPIKKPAIQTKVNLEKPINKKEILVQPNTKPDAQGKITEAGKFFNRPGTHRLVKHGRTHYFLKSDKVDINAFTYHQVQVWGKIKSSKKSKIPIIEVDFIKKLN
ncbi:MAG: SH3 domain-containing protein [Candidatus Omnitrophica bacterium]|nr:SH3 domain-containing protein [Candidatus Omnitrophota bacterium]